MNGTALVTGGTRRIGRAIVERLVREGYAVAIHANWSYGPAVAFRDDVVQAGGRAAVVTAELADIESVLGLIDAARDQLGPLTLLVNNASAFEPDELDTLTPDEWDRQLAVNLRAPVFLARDFARQAPEGSDAAVVNILDQRVWKPTPHYFSYALAKSALLAATVTMAQALAPRVRVNAVGPGPTLKSARQEESDFARQALALLLGRGPTPEEIADAVVFLAGARSITGQMIAVDGGQHLAWQTPDVLGIRE